MKKMETRAGGELPYRLNSLGRVRSRLKKTRKDIFCRKGKNVTSAVVISPFVCYNDRNRVGGSELASAGDTGS